MIARVYQAVLLDVYGTLVRDDSAWAADAVAEIAARAGAEPAAVAAEWDRRLYALADTAHGPGFRTLAQLNHDSLTGTADHFRVRVDAADLCHRPARSELYPEARAFLAAVGVPVCLVSDADTDPLRAVLDHHGITVAAVVTSEDARAYKPRPEPFRLALHRLGLTATDVVHVGDSPACDIAGAAALGIDTAFVGRGRELPAQLRATRTGTVLTDLLPLGCDR